LRCRSSSSAPCGGMRSTEPSRTCPDRIPPGPRRAPPRDPRRATRPRRPPGRAEGPTAPPRGACRTHRRNTPTERASVPGRGGALSAPPASWPRPDAHDERQVHADLLRPCRAVRHGGVARASPSAECLGGLGGPVVCRRAAAMDRGSRSSSVGGAWGVVIRSPEGYIQTGLRKRLFGLRPWPHQFRLGKARRER